MTSSSAIDSSTTGDARQVKSAPDFIRIREEVLSIIYGEERGEEVGD